MYLNITYICRTNKIYVPLLTKKQYKNLINKLKINLIKGGNVKSAGVPFQTLHNVYFDGAYPNASL
jgi:hypothetical protein